MKRRNYLLALAAAAVITGCTDASQISAPASPSEDKAGQVNPQWDWDGIGIATGCPGCVPPPGCDEPQSGASEPEVTAANYPCDPSTAPPDYVYRSGEYDGSGTNLGCGYGFRDQHCDRIDQALDWLMNHSESLCRQLGHHAFWRLYNSGEYFLWSHPSYYGGSSLSTGEVGLTQRAFSQGQLANTIAHEESHFLGYLDKYNPATGALNPKVNGMYADDIGKLCAHPSI